MVLLVVPLHVIIGLLAAPPVFARLADAPRQVSAGITLAALMRFYPTKRHAAEAFREDQAKTGPREDGGEPAAPLASATRLG